MKRPEANVETFFISFLVLRFLICLFVASVVLTIFAGPTHRFKRITGHTVCIKHNDKVKTEALKDLAQPA